MDESYKEDWATWARVKLIKTSTLQLSVFGFFFFQLAAVFLFMAAIFFSIVFSWKHWFGVSVFLSTVLPYITVITFLPVNAAAGTIAGLLPEVGTAQLGTKAGKLTISAAQFAAIGGFTISVILGNSVIAFGYLSPPGLVFALLGIAFGLGLWATAYEKSKWPYVFITGLMGALAIPLVIYYYTGPIDPATKLTKPLFDIGWKFLTGKYTTPALIAGGIALLIAFGVLLDANNRRRKTQ